MEHLDKDLPPTPAVGWDTREAQARAASARRLNATLVDRYYGRRP